MRKHMSVGMHRLGARKLGCRRGAAVVEFAVVAPVLILFLLGIIECGRMVMVQQSLTTAVREGARTASMEGNSASDAIDAVTSLLLATGIKGTDVTVTPIDTWNVGHGRPITVSVSVPFTKVSWLPNPFFFQNTTLRSAATMCRETPN